jgi:hypothetical protein
MTARHASGIAGKATQLMRDLDALKSLTEKSERTIFRPVVHYLDWMLRLMPVLPPTETFLSHAKQYCTAAKLLRAANGLVSDFLARNHCPETLTSGAPSAGMHSRWLQHPRRFRCSRAATPVSGFRKMSSTKSGFADTPETACGYHGR